MGFDGRWVKSGNALCFFVSYTIVHVNREMENITRRGLQQKDPLSLYLFIIGSEGLSALFRHYEKTGLIHGCSVARGAPKISHMLFANDTYIFCQANNLK